jgi:hypothetical protein
MPQERPEVDFLILADRAEGLNGKLYMMGGGWQEIYIRDFSQPTSFSLAVGVLVPWNATNEEHPLTIHIETDDGTRIEPHFPVKLNVGRPPQAVPGQQFRTMIAIQGSWKLPGPGTYKVIANLQAMDAKAVTFRAISAASKT